LENGLEGGEQIRDEGITTIEEPKGASTQAFAVLDRSVEGASGLSAFCRARLHLREGVNGPNERKPIFFIPIGKRLDYAGPLHGLREGQIPLPPLAESYFDKKAEGFYLDVC